MSRWIESLEDRALFSASPLAIVADEKALFSDAKSAIAVLRSAVAAYHSESAKLAADIKALPRTKANNALIVKLSRDQARASAAIAADGNKLVVADETSFRSAVADGIADYLSPTAANNARLAKAISTAQSIAARPIAALEAQLTASGKTIDADLNALAAANPTAATLNSDVASAKATQSATATAITTQVTLLQSDLGKLTTDLQA